MPRRVFVVSGEYSANPRYLTSERRSRDWLSQPHPELDAAEVSRLFFRFPNRGEDGRAGPDDWRRDFGLESPIGLTDLFASAAHRALTSLHRVIGGEYSRTREAITHLYVTSMPGLDPNERLNIGLVPQALRALLRLSRRVVAQYVVGTSDSGAWAFAHAVRAARSADQPLTMLVVAGQIIPAGYTSQYQIRSVLGEDDQSRGMDMLAVGDLLMDSFRRSLGLSRLEVQRFLSAVAERKFEDSVFYPAGIAAGAAFERKSPRTPYFDASDIAAPCCGAAATIITSDEELVSRIAAARSPRYRALPLTEVLGVGEGSSSENVLHRASPLVFSTAVREALADTADDAQLPLATFRSSAFGVAHDAFPSIELAFMLAMGFSWERAAERMIEGWPNPFGGLLTFGHALGASGLVQVNKAHHLFCGDLRHIGETAEPRRGFQRRGTVAFTTSVGGPLSHIVAALLRGGFAEIPNPSGKELRRTKRSTNDALTAEWRIQRHQARRVMPAYLARLRGRLSGDIWLVEGITYVSVRSALRALTPEDVSRLTFDGLERLVEEEHLSEVRAQVREVVLVVMHEAERVATMFDAFRMLTDEVRALSKTWRGAGFLTPRASALADGKLADRVKECLRVPLAVLYGTSTERSTRRRLLVLPAFDLTYEQLEGVDLLSSSRNGHGRLTPIKSEPTLLPFWNVRAARPDNRATSPTTGAPWEVIDRILDRRDGPESAAELQLLRSWFIADPPPPVLQQALLTAGAQTARAAPAMRSILYVGEIANRGNFADPGSADELVARAAREAAAFLEPYEVALKQIGDVIAMGAFERPPFQANIHDGIASVARFAREVAQASFEQGIILRAAISTGEGTNFEDAAGEINLASTSHRRATELLRRLQTEAGCSSLAIDDMPDALLERVQRRLPGWMMQRDGETGCAIWRMRGPSTDFPRQ